MSGTVFPPCCLTWGQTMVEIMKIMVTSFKRSHACTAALSASNTAPGHCQPMPPPETPGHSWACLGQFLVWVSSFLLSPGASMNFQIFKLDLEKPEEPEIKLPTSVRSSKKQENTRKTYTSALLTTPKPLCGSQQNVGNSSRDGNNRPPDLPPEKSACRSRSNS